MEGKSLETSYSIYRQCDFHLFGPNQKSSDETGDDNRELKIMEELVKRVSDFVEMEHRSGSMQLISAEYVARCMQIAKEDAAAALEALKK